MGPHVKLQGIALSHQKPREPAPDDLCSMNRTATAGESVKLRNVARLGGKILGESATCSPARAAVALVLPSQAAYCPHHGNRSSTIFGLSAGGSLAAHGDKAGADCSGSGR